MLTVSEAEKIIWRSILSYKAMDCPIEKSLGSVLRERIRADRNLPDFNKSTMDGIAVSYDLWDKGVRSFPIEGTQAAGYKAIDVRSAKNCVEIMTGAVVPEPFDCVIPIEHVEIHDQTATIKLVSNFRRYQNMNLKASDYKKNDVLLESGTMLLAPQIGVLASVGKTKVKVSPKLKIAIISTGDEIVDLNYKNIKPYQIRKSNSYALKAALDQTQLFESEMFHLKDNVKDLKVGLKKILSKFDVVILSGGVSAGKFDYVPQVLKSLKVRVVFHKVQQKPGKPFWFGKSEKSQPVFALPGNPISTLVCFYRYVLPSLKKALKAQTIDYVSVRLSDPVDTKSKLTHFLPVKVNCDLMGQLWAHPVEISGSGDFAHFAQSDGFIELPAKDNPFKRGYIAKFFDYT